MTTKTTKPLAGEIADIAFKFTAAGAEYAEVDIRQRPDDKYPTRARAFDAALVERFRKARKGLYITLDIQEEQGTYQNRPITYRNIVGILPNAKLPPAGAPPETEPFPVAGATKEPPQTSEKGGSTHSGVQEGKSTHVPPPEASSTPETRLALVRPTLSPGMDKYSAAAIIYEQDQMNRRTGLMQAVALLLDDRTSQQTWRELADEMFKWLKE